MEDKKSNSLLLPVGAVVVLVAALGLGMGIRKVRFWRTEPETKEQVKMEAERSDAEIPAESVVAKAAEGERVEVSRPKMSSRKRKIRAMRPNRKLRAGAGL